MGEQPLGNGLVVHPRPEILQIGQRFGVALPGFFGVAPDNLLETGVLGHGKPPLDTSPHSDAVAPRPPPLHHLLHAPD